MNLSKLLRLTLLIISSALAVNAAPRELVTSADGGGNLERGNRENGVAQANLTLKRDGTFSLNLISANVVNFNGTWQAADKNSIYLEVTSAWGRSAEATGKIELDGAKSGNYRIDSIKIAGTQRGEVIKARFKTGADAPVIVQERPHPPVVVVPPPAPTQLINSTRGGRGVFHMAGTPPYRLTHAFVQLFDTGRVYLNVFGEINLGYVGTWRDAGSGNVRLDVRGGIANERITGILSLTDRSFTNVTLDGTVSGNFYKIEFDVR